MKKIAPLTFKFAYVQSSVGEMGVRNAYRWIFEMAKENILMRNDILSGDMRIVDNGFGNAQTVVDDKGRVFNDSGSIGEPETFSRNDLSNDKKERDSGGEDWNEVANKQSVSNQFIKTGK